MTNPQLGIAVVGCGTIGQTHLATAEQLDDLAVVALVDPFEGASTAFADRLEAHGRPRPRTYIELADALSDPLVDLVAVATPTGLHIEQGLEVLAADKHLILEKPLGVDLARAGEIEEAATAAAQRGVVASVISQHRFDPSSQIVAEAVASGKFGRLTSAVASLAWWRSQGYYDSGDWRGTWAMDGGGALMNQGIHTLDLLLWYMGKPIEVYAHTRLLAHERVEIEDTAVATIVFESGALAAVHATTAAYPALTAKIQLMGSAGSAIIDGDELTYFHVSRENDDVGAMGLGGGGNQAAQVLGLAKAPSVDTVTDPTADHAGHTRQYRDVLRAITEGTSPGVTVSDAMSALATIRAVYISSTLGHPVLYEDVISGKYNDLTVRTGR